MRSYLLYGFSILSACTLPSLASAHEVYVLPAATIRQALMTPSFSEWQTLLQNIDQFALWGFITALTIFIVFFVSISRVLERLLDPLLSKLPRYAPLICRVTIGVSFLSAVQHQALFGPELPLIATFGNATYAVSILLVVIGIMITVGFYTRIAALAAIILFGIEVSQYGVYMLTYTNYIGELILLLVLGAHLFAVHSEKISAKGASVLLRIIKERFTPYSFFILRVAFGVGLLYAAFYAKIIHNNLALDLLYAYPQIVHFFGFEPHFLVLGAAIIEILIALFFIFGIEIRFTSLFLLFWLSLSLWYFGEVVWPHIILIGIPIAFIFYGYDAYSLEGRFFKKDGREPVL